jgi:hypothetical protein
MPVTSTNIKGHQKDIHSQNTPARQNESQTSWNGKNIVLIGLAIAGVAALAFVLTEIASLIKEVVDEKLHPADPVELEKRIKNKFSERFVNKLKCLRDLDYIRLFRRMCLCKEEEVQIFTQLDLAFDIDPIQLEQILKGAHVRLDDNGEMYEKWVSELKKKNERVSSHGSDKQQYGIQGPFIKELLFSRITDEQGHKQTWFQLENHPVSLGHIIRHMIDYFKYKFTRENQGPYGSSPFTDSVPIILKTKQ